MNYRTLIRVGDIRRPATQEDINDAKDKLLNLSGRHRSFSKRIRRI